MAREPRHRTKPYDWKRHRPRLEIPRPELTGVAEELCDGGSGVLLAGRGMGKSVFLRQLQRRIAEDSCARVVLFPEPPPQLTVRSCLEALAVELGVEARRLMPEGAAALTARHIVHAYLEGAGVDRLVLLYDELDRYGRPGQVAASAPPGREFFNSLELMRRETPEVGILAAGSIGVFVFRDVFGSSFVARADKVRIRPFQRGEIQQLAVPFAERRDQALSGETIEALHLASGGNPALVTYGLGELWRRPWPSEKDVTEAFVKFRERNGEFLRDFQQSFTSPQLSDAPQKVLELIQQSDGEVTHDSLQQACSGSGGVLELDFGDVLDLLEAAGLVRVTGSALADPVLVRPVSSVLILTAATSAVTTPRASSRMPLSVRLRQDLAAVLARLHTSSADFFRPGNKEREKRLVPEAVFSAYLALGMELKGWQVDREAQRVAGRTDLQLRWNGSRELAVIEVKIWGRRDYRNVQRQVASYWSAETVAGAVVMITDAELPRWVEVYLRECLAALDADTEATGEGSPLRALLHATSETTDGIRVGIDHFLLRLPRGR